MRSSLQYWRQQSCFPSGTLSQIDGPATLLPQLSQIDGPVTLLPHMVVAPKAFALYGDVSLPAGADCQKLASYVADLYHSCVFLGKVGQKGGACDLILQNDAEDAALSWPEDTRLRLVCGDGAGVQGEKDCVVGSVGAGESVGMRFEFGADCSVPGTHSYWVLTSGDKVFGPMYCVQRIQ